jgi:hypothetical protein
MSCFMLTFIDASGKMIFDKMKKLINDSQLKNYYTLLF